MKTETERRLHDLVEILENTGHTVIFGEFVKAGGSPSSVYVSCNYRSLFNRETKKKLDREEFGG